MNAPSTFEEVLDAVEELDEESQQELIKVVGRRLAERGRERLIATVTRARKEFADGECKPMTAAEILREAQS